MKRLAVIVVAAALVGGIAGGAIEAALGDSSTSSESTPAPPPTTSSAATTAQGSRVLTPEAIYRDDAPGVVVITATDTETIPATLFAPASKQQVRSLGSGFVIDTKGDIVTNDHVVQGASALRVGFSGGATYPATVVGKDPSTDLAVIRVRAPETALHPLSFDPSSTIQVGDPFTRSATRSALTGRSPRASPAQPAATSRRRTASRSTMRSRPTPPSTTGTREGPSSTDSAG